MHNLVLSPIERKALAELTKRVRTKFDKALDNLTGNKLRYMTPGFCDVEPLSEGNFGEQSAKKFASWCNQPFFTLDKYSGDLFTKKPGSHPVHTLWQTRSHTAKKERDMEQAVCRLKGSDTGS